MPLVLIPADEPKNVPSGCQVGHSHLCSFLETLVGLPSGQGSGPKWQDLPVPPYQEVKQVASRHSASWGRNNAFGFPDNLRMVSVSGSHAMLLAGDGFLFAVPINADLAVLQNIPCKTSHSCC